MSHMDERWPVRGRSARRALAFGLVALGVILNPTVAAPQGEVSTGILLVPGPGVGGPQAGPAVSVAVLSRVLQLPLLFEVGVARTDFNSLGQNYHHNHYLIVLSVEWFPIQGPTRLGVRFGLGAYGEYEIVESDPAYPGGDNWVEAVVPGLVLEHDLGEEKRLVLALTDSVLGPYYAILDPEEYGVEHRVRLMLGLRF